MTKLNKQQARELAPKGWVWIYNEGPFYVYQTGNYTEGFFTMRVKDCDMKPEVLARMVELKLTR